MRKLGISLIMLSLMLTGCEWMNRNKNVASPGPKVQASGQPSAQDLVKYLNEHADQLAVIESDDVYLTVIAQKTRLPGLRCTMACEKPRNFRLTGELASTDYVDIGSNNNQFWFWVKDGETPPLYFCSYADYEKGVKLPMPFQPEWVVQALGMAKYDPTKQYKVQANGRTFELIEETTLQGQAVRKITVFAAGQVQDTYPRVMGHIVQDAQTGKTICQATIRRVRTVNGISYPSDVLLEWPNEQLSMTMKVGKATLNQKIAPDLAGRYFTLPNWDGLKKIDLARGNPNGSPTSRVVQTGGYQTAPLRRN